MVGAPRAGLCFIYTPQRFLAYINDGHSLFGAKSKKHQTTTKFKIMNEALIPKVGRSVKTAEPKGAEWNLGGGKRKQDELENK